MADAIISKTQALPDGTMLWCVHHKGSYYDNDSRGSGYVPVDERTFVLAKDVDEAKRKASTLPSVIEATKRADGTVEVDAAIVTIESLIPARDSSQDERGGWRSTETLHPVSLPHAEDGGWKLAVCLVRVA